MKKMGIEKKINESAVIRLSRFDSGDGSPEVGIEAQRGRLDAIARKVDDAGRVAADLDHCTGCSHVDVAISLDRYFPEA